MGGFEVHAAAAAWLVFGTVFVADYARFTHGQALSGDRAASRLLESHRLREYWPMVLIMLAILAAWPGLLVVDTARWALRAASSRRAGDRHDRSST